MPSPQNQPERDPSTTVPHNPEKTDEDFFSDAFFIVGYTTAQAIEDGALLEVDSASDVRRVKIELGRIVSTPGAIKVLEDAEMSPHQLLARHQSGDWGDLDSHDRAVNDRAMREGSRLLSRYEVPGAPEPVWIITEWDRSVTTLLLPSEY